MIIRDVEVRDFIRIDALYEQIDKIHRDVHNERFQVPNIPGRSEEYKEELISNCDSQFIVAEDNEVVIGFAEARTMNSLDFQVLRKRKWLQINSIVVDEAYRGSGIGQALFDYLTVWAKQREISSIELNVYSFNEPARGFYEKNGFNEMIRTMTKNI